MSKIHYTLLFALLLLVACKGDKKTENSDNAGNLTTIENEVMTKGDSLQLFQQTANLTDRTIINDIYTDITGDNLPDYICAYYDWIEDEEDGNARKQYGLTFVDGKDPSEAQILYNLCLGKDDNDATPNQFMVNNLIKRGMNLDISISHDWGATYKKVAEGKGVKDNYSRTLTFAYNASVDGLELVLDKKNGTTLDIKKHKIPAIAFDEWGAWYHTTYSVHTDYSKIKKIVVANNLKEFVNGVDDGTMLFLLVDELNLDSPNLKEILSSTRKNENKIEVDKDGENLLISNATDLSILSPNTNIYVEGGFKYVMRFKNCTNLNLSGLTMLHILPEEESVCHAPVVDMTDMSNVAITHCSFDGCGLDGLILENTKNVNMYSSSFFNNKSNCIIATNVENMYLGDCTFYENQCATSIIHADNADMHFVKCDIVNNITPHLVILYKSNGGKLVFEKCSEYSNYNYEEDEEDMTESTIMLYDTVNYNDYKILNKSLNTEYLKISADN